MGEDMVCGRCGYHGSGSEYRDHECPNSYSLEEFESLSWDADDWFLALREDNALYLRILDGIGRETSKWRKKYNRMPPSASEYERMRTRRGGIGGAA